ncbi:MAG: tetratricopeptide repeat protein [Chloroflexi bacterium]|nr:tetratricopeptide repeat protein [Chloroflexota bacterium]MBT4004197.1 tetratricopeptide repeat protein [Chloroflexota bacterium]MBT4534628.1 tetratricopeptide repeat protein [Chloroflexota bacterium]MBT4682652.1 tetratricopeptide repeat protein [Chloroflexota bacterium]MBT6989366.1 tetratricopeptide repeat protein [Chloroflexota bacterium]
MFTPDVIKTIVWALAMIIVLTIFILIFKKQLASRIEKIGIRVKKGDAELEISENITEPPSEIISDVSQTEYINLEDKIEADRDISDNTKDDSETLTSKMWESYEENDLAEMKKSFLELNKIEGDSQKKLENEVLYNSMLQRRGNSEALKELNRLAENSMVASYAFTQLGNCYEFNGNYLEAIKMYEKAYEISDSDIKKANRLVDIALNLSKFDNPQTGIDKILAEIDNFSDSDAISSTYSGLSTLYKEIEDVELETLALEKAIEYGLNDTDLLFKLAYLYGENNQDNMAILHYENSILINPKNSAVLNNLGVSYSDLQLPTKAVNYYEKAHDLKNTLASSNLAIKLINEGFSNIAKKLLDEAKNQKKVSSNVNKYIARLNEKEESENKIYTELIENAKKIRSFRRLYAEKLFTINSEIPTIKGNWGKINNEVIIITQNETFFEGKWKERNTNKKIDGTIKNNSGKITFSTEKKKPNTVNEYHYVNDFNAIFYLSEDIKQIKIMTEDSKNEFLTLELLTTVENGQTIEE